MLLVFAAITHDPAAVQEGIREVAGDVPVLGCTTHGEIGPGGPKDGSVTVAAIGGTGFRVTTASIGIAYAAPGETEPALLMRRADLAMYRAKHGGRGRFELAAD